MQQPIFTAKELDGLLAGLTPGDIDELLKVGVGFNPDSRSIVMPPDTLELGREVLWRRCEDDEEFFLLDSGLVKTEDHEERWQCRDCNRIFEAHKPKACEGPEWDRGCGSKHVYRRSPFQPFPYETHLYLRDAMWGLSHKRRVAFPKGRRLLMSELVSGHGLHGTMFHEAFSGIYQTHKEDKADENVQRTYGQWSRLPSWMKARRPANPQKNSGEMKLYFTIPSNHANIIGLPQGPEQIKSSGPTLMWMDEFGDFPEAEETYGTIQPTMKAGTQLVITGTAMPGYWDELIHDRLG